MSIDLNFLEEVARDLPIIRPIKEFIHLNLLLPYQHLPFWEALLQVGLKLEAFPFADINFYRERIKSGEIPLALIEAKIEKLPSHIDKIKVFDQITKNDFNFVHHDPRVGPLHDEWNDLIGINVIQLADGMLIKWLGMFLDQGISHWQMPGSDDKSFYHCMRDLILNSAIKPDPFSRNDVARLFPEDAVKAIEEHLDYLCPEKKLQKEYCSESILTLRGWAGMIFTIQQNAAVLSFPRKITLIDFLAMKLTLERAWICAEGGKISAPDFKHLGRRTPHPLNDEAIFTAFRIFQEVFEEATYGKVIQELVSRKKHRLESVSYQAVFCMDDRECGLRRHLEGLSPKIETFGTAGHFGIECLYQHPDDPFPKKQCPAPVPAKYLLKDYPKEQIRKNKNKESLSHQLIQPSNDPFMDWIMSHVSAGIGAFKLASNLFFPLALKNLENVREVRPDTELKLKRTQEPAPGELKEGYTLEEMAQVVYSQLQLIGFVHRFAPLVFFMGHGSNSSNNPYFATYGCGACSGRPGAANARALAQMANDPEVRALVLSKFGLKIPEQTFFVGAMHDTCRDVVEIFDPHKIPGDHALAFKQFKNYLSIALFKNARERSKMFKLVSYRTISKEAQKEVLRRSYSLFETRPELGHTNVTYAIVGKRDLTHGMDLKRRSFLQSYDRTVDPEGKLLAATLGAVIPVCSGISLDYFFSRVDNLRFGAGSKLPQNIVGNIGVSHGTESDLLFGLPFQMIDQHQPLRLVVIVDHAPEVALSAIQGNALVRQIVYNNWIHYFCFDGETEKVYHFSDGQMVLSET